MGHILHTSLKHLLFIRRGEGGTPARDRGNDNIATEDRKIGEGGAFLRRHRLCTEWRVALIIYVWEMKCSLKWNWLTLKDIPTTTSEPSPLSHLLQETPDHPHHRAVASRRTSCRQWPCCRWKRGRRRRCSQRWAPWTSAQRTRPPWRRQTGWSWNWRRFPGTQFPGWNSCCQCTSGTSRSIWLGGCWRCRQSSRAVWRRRRWWLTSRWWRWPKGLQRPRCCAYSWHGRFWKLLAKATFFSLPFSPFPRQNCVNLVLPVHYLPPPPLVERVTLD